MQRNAVIPQTLQYYNAVESFWFLIPESGFKSLRDNLRNINIREA